MLYEIMLTKKQMIETRDALTEYAKLSAERMREEINNMQITYGTQEAKDFSDWAMGYAEALEAITNTIDTIDMKLEEEE